MLNPEVIERARERGYNLLDKAEGTFEKDGETFRWVDSIGFFEKIDSATKRPASATEKGAEATERAPEDIVPAPADMSVKEMDTKGKAFARRLAIRKAGRNAKVPLIPVPKKSMVALVKDVLTEYKARKSKEG